MGHLFSRAIKRLTFGAGSGSGSGSSSSSSSRSASGNQLPSNEQQEHAQGASQREQDLSRPIVQAIPVGQSIDSAEYAAFENASNVLPKQTQQLATEAKQTIPPQHQALVEDHALDGDKENAASTKADDLANDEDDDKNKPEVEEAVIKIQALVRGHLTRKALKDAQQHAATVSPYALGQRQFDEESLIKNPPSAIFLPSSPLSSNLANNESSNNDQQQQQQQQQSNKHANSRVPPLESISEDVETSTSNQDQSLLEEEQQERRKLSLSNGATVTTPTSPQPTSEANASIDIYCNTPASASIDILDHHSSKPNFGLASVLHCTTLSAQTNTGLIPDESSSTTNKTSDDGVELQASDEAQISLNTTPASRSSSFANNHNQRAMGADLSASTTGSLPASPPHINLVAAHINSHSIDSAEAAAIRIQSAFRGYHTRKHSPYRRRSPANVAAAAASNDSAPRVNGYGRGAELQESLDQLEAALVDDDDYEGGKLAENLANIVLEDEEEEDLQNNNNNNNNNNIDIDIDNDGGCLEHQMSELESDDIERRDPLGRASEESKSRSPQVGTESFEEQRQPALVSSSSLDDQEKDCASQQQLQQEEEDAGNDQRLEVVSPDEAIGSGGSSPALVSSNGDNDSTDDDADAQEDLETDGKVAASRQGGGASSSGAANKNKKRNRNKRKGKK